MNRCVIQLSDLHFQPEGLLYDRVDCRERLAAMLDALASSGCRPDALVLSGDLADEGHPDAYRLLRETVEPAAAELGAPVVYLPGNHDDSAVLERELLDREPDGRPLDQVVWAGGLRIVALDSTDPSGHHGWLEDGQLAWLRDVLAEPAPEGTLLAVHHPPIASPTQLINHLLLREPERLAAAIADTGVRLIVCGHAHHVSCGALAGVPVWIAPATVYATDVLVPEGLFRGLMGGGFTRIDVVDGVPVATFVPLADGSEPLYAHDVSELLTAAAGPR